MRFDRIVLWQPIDSPHQEAFLESLALQFTGEVILGVEQEMPVERRAQGWRTPSHTNVRVIDISIPANHAALASYTTASSLHVFSGFFSHPLVWAGFHRLASSEARLAIMSEAPEQTIWTGWLKRLRGKVLTARWSRRFAFVLAIGGIGCEFFVRIGFPTEKVLPFGYFINTPFSEGSAATRPDDGCVRLVSAGQLIRRKGVDLLIEACADLPPGGWTLDIFGDGPERQRLERAVARHRLGDRVRFRGTASNNRLRPELETFDRAILPSRFDGWGALVNEALAVGTPVICTDRCGAATLVAGGPGNRVVPAGRVESLAAAIADAVADGPTAAQARDVTRQAAEAKFSASRAASRFLLDAQRGCT